MEMDAIKNQVSALTASFGASTEDALRSAQTGDSSEAADAFEAMLATMLVKEMRSSLSKGLFGEGAGADAYESWFDQNLGQSLADSDALGLAGIVKASIDRAAAKEELDEMNTQPAEIDQ